MRAGDVGPSLPLVKAEEEEVVVVVEEEERRMWTGETSQVPRLT